MRAGLDEVQLRDLVPGRAGRVGDDGPHLGLRTLQRRRVAPQQVDHPGDGVGGGVLAGQQHGQHVAADLLVVDAAAGFVGRGEHGLEQVLGVLAAARIGHQARPGLGDEAVDRLVHLGHAAFQLAVGRAAPPAPDRQG